MLMMLIIQYLGNLPQNTFIILMYEILSPYHNIREIINYKL